MVASKMPGPHKGIPEQTPGKLNLADRLDSALPVSRLALLKVVAGQAQAINLAVYLVGGIVRDLLLGRSGQDFDVVVEGDAIALAKRLAAEYGGRIVAHSRFGTATWRFDEENEAFMRRLGLDAASRHPDLPRSLDLVSARSETYARPGALPTVSFDGLQPDLLRRDFTINAMALRLDAPHYGELYDDWGGLADLERGLVRVLHPLSFIDDPTRMYRAVRFEQRFGFQIEPATLGLLSEAIGYVEKVSGQRLRHELDLILSEEKAISMLKRLDALSLLRAIHPGLTFSDEIGRRMAGVKESLPEHRWKLPSQFAHLPSRLALAYLAWLGDQPADQSRSVAERLRLPSAVCEALEGIHALQKDLPGLAGKPPSQVVRRLDKVPLLALCAVRYFDLPSDSASLVPQYLDTWRHIRPTINGDDLVRMGIRPGPVYKKILEGLRAAWLDGKVTSVEEEQAYLKTLLPG